MFWGIFLCVKGCHLCHFFFLCSYFLYFSLALVLYKNIPWLLDVLTFVVPCHHFSYNILNNLLSSLPQSILFLLCCFCCCSYCVWYWTWYKWAFCMWLGERDVWRCDCMHVLTLQIHGKNHFFLLMLYCCQFILLL